MAANRRAEFADQVKLMATAMSGDAKAIKKLIKDLEKD